MYRGKATMGEGDLRARISCSLTVVPSSPPTWIGTFSTAEVGGTLTQLMDLGETLPIELDDGKRGRVILKKLTVMPGGFRGELQGTGPPPG